MTTIISAWIFKTKLNLLSKFGVLIALLGSIGVVNYATPECGQFWCNNTFAHIGRGEVYGILATLVFACYSVVSRCAAQRKVSSLVMNSYASIIGGILLGFVAAFKADFSVIPNLGISFWLAFFYITILATIVAYLWYTDAIIHLGVFKTVIFQNTIPLQTVLIGYLFFHEGIGIKVLGSGIVVLLGVYITNIALNKKAKL
jgi:drug/metabolite transporter (DMT)-like permease